ncbi:galectin-3-like isoform X1 [Cyprinus carpio]|uniref:Galectin n=1 Tax=Cyprinus carpio TaxID=7962 RepID=A0A9Q9VF66_CYPCA|nr:galectin-3-like isoform X1 [Cyprinus carpio]
MDLSDALDFPQQNNQQAGGAVWPGQPANPTWPGQPVNPTWPGQPANPTAANPTWPGQPVNPTWPGQPVNPTWPGQPANPTWPGQPANPTCPGQPANPTCPGQPANPTWPGQPANPTWPAQPNQPAWPGQPGQPTAPGWPGPAPQTSPRALTVPFDLPLQSGIYNKMLITIAGEIKLNANNFTVNFKRGSDIAFHLNPRFNEGGRQVIVRNSMIGNQWGREERELPSFPFVPGKPFELKILCTDTEFKVAVNKSHLLEYKHRIRELNQIRDLSVYGDVTLSSVNVETLQ